ncbi:head-tail connector protein [Mycobacterium phage EagleEye]|uniref:Head-to-tail connector protein n=1 Tax=Mycobacterium phage EagleEye TaxID=1429759 RepID=W0LMN4_9CAUD|nr:head-tail connector protein [Mycobacterium phage EagleEye]AHG23799.1 hypothetical protein PBI_EAGLEEYE_19 [Mycobacterium phage EagleEye]QDK03454.1 hypothetical protein SEA_LUCYEDI_18 [Mycobacterium phage Lucyedi]QNJ55812.1 hypothetical protein SEA_PAINTERBOY_18 [Mycobacterium phage PainterBoy]
MQIRSTINGGVAEVEDALGERLISLGGWESAEDKPKPARKSPAKKAAAKTAPAQEPSTQE